MLNLLSSPTDIQDIEDKVDQQMESVASLINDEKGKKEITIDEDFPESFRQQMEGLAVGEVGWDRFFSQDGVYAVHGRMGAGSAIQEHVFTNATAYLYLIEGRVINWSRETYDGDVVVPADEVNEMANLMHDTSINGWYKISPTSPHWIQSLIDSHFVIKFKLNDA
jgi:hypothetical protein